jgi:hypothetical protein
MAANEAILNLTCYYLNIYYCRVMLRHFEFLQYGGYAGFLNLNLTCYVNKAANLNMGVSVLFKLDINIYYLNTPTRLPYGFKL